MPPETWPIVQAHWCQPKSFLAMANYLESLPTSASQASECAELPAHIPVTIISASNSSAAQLAERDPIAGHSLHGKHVIATKSGHWIHFDEPELVIQAIREMAGLTAKITPSDTACIDPQSPPAGFPTISDTGRNRRRLAHVPDRGSVSSARGSAPLPGSPPGASPPAQEHQI